MTYALVKNGAVVQVGLPETGVLADGRLVSGFDRLDAETLAAEGWLPLLDGRPEYDPARTFLAAPEYSVEGLRVVSRYTVTPLPPALGTDAYSIPADGTTAATVTYTDHSPTAPLVVTFLVNGATADSEVRDGVATIEVVASTPGPVEVSVASLDDLIVITAEEVTP